MGTLKHRVGRVARVLAHRGSAARLACCAGLLGVVLVGRPHVARADSVTMTLQNDTSMLQAGCVTLYAEGSTPATATPGMHEWVYIGEFHWQQTGTPSGLLGNTFGTFCIELPQSLDGGPTFTYDAGTALGQSAVASSPSIDLGFSPIGSARAALVNELFAQDYSKVTNAASAAQFQIAIWDSIYNYGYSTPYLSFTGISTTLADGWYADAVTALNANGGAAPDANLVVLTNPNAQDQITVAAAPLPAPAALGLLLLSGLGAFRMVRRYDAAHEQP